MKINLKVIIYESEYILRLKHESKTNMKQIVVCTSPLANRLADIRFYHPVLLDMKMLGGVDQCLDSI